MDTKYVFQLVWSGWSPKPDTKRGLVYLYNANRCYILQREGESYTVRERDGKENERVLGENEMKTFIGRMLSRETWNLSAGTVGSKIPLFVPVA